MTPKFTKCLAIAILLFLGNQELIARSNPIIDLVNNPNNDVNGNISTCGNDGSMLPKIFLCGVNDVANLIVNYPSAQNIAWQKLDESSCTNFGDDCTNKSPSCVYNTVSNGAIFPVNAAGKYRLSVLQGNGVFENHYFHVYQNSLEVLYQKVDIGCEPTGNITVTNLDSNYGFQLVDADSNQILVPFNANNGPSFIINSNGNYRVETIQLNPNTGNPIENGCVFNTPNIAVDTSNFQVQTSSTEADCNGVGTVTITATSGTPNYIYELRLDDGLDGGRGTLIDVVANQTANTYTFTGVGQGDYLVVGRNSNGCQQSAPATVVVSSENTLTFSARVSQHITCKEGNILVNPNGGKPPYRYAIWKYVDKQDNVITTYNTPLDIPNSEFQTREIFDIYDPGNYSFVLIDRFGCFTISNSVDIEFVPPAEFDVATVTDIACLGNTSGEIKMNLIDSNGYQIQYYLFDYIITTAEANADDFTFSGAIAFNASGYFLGLMAGEYTVVANMRKGSSNCNFAENMLIEVPDGELAGEAILVQPYTCTQTATIRANNYGGGTPFTYGIGVPGYDFSLNGSQWQSGNDTFTDLQPGIYTIFIRDSKGCIIETNPVEILPADSPENLIFSLSQITCDNPTSDVTVTIVGGTPSYIIEITSPTIISPNSIVDNVAVFENLAPGIYSFEVTDVNQCTYKESFTILPITEIDVVGVLLKNVSCSGLSDGTIRYTVNGFETTYSYTVVNSVGITVTSGNAVAIDEILLIDQPGETYTITVTDDLTACRATDTITIDAPDTPLSATLQVVDLSCTTIGNNPGSVTVTTTGGWGSYEYELEAPSGIVVGPQTTGTFTGLTDTSGNYTITVTDAGSCEVTQAFMLSPVSTPVLEVTANSLCYDSTNGLTLTANVTSGGLAPFQYRLSPNGAFQSSPVFSGLVSGSYTVEVIDSKNCTASDTIEVFSTLTATANLVKDLDCSATPDAEISINISGGNLGFSYEVFRDGILVESNTTVPSIPFSYFTTIAGIYEFIITDSESCTVTTSAVVVSPVVTPSASTNVTDVSCNGNTDGSVVITIDTSLGLPPFTISFDGSPFSSQTVFGDLASGTYNYSIRDSKGCQFTNSVTIDESTTVSATSITANPITCVGAGNQLGSIEIIGVTGGTPDYTYYLYDNTGELATTSTTNPTGPTSATSLTFNNLNFGDYYPKIIDANGCEYNFGPYRITSPPNDLDIISTSSGNCITGVNYDVNIVGGTGPFEVRIYDSGVFTTVNGLPTSSGSTSERNHQFSGLLFGISYVFEVLDTLTGCTYIEQVPAMPNPSTIDITGIPTDITCNTLDNGQLDFTVSNYNGMSLNWEVFENLTGNAVVGSANTISGLTGADFNNSVTGLTPGDYYILVRETDAASTACSDIFVFRIEEPTPLELNIISQTNANCNENAQIVVRTIGGNGPYSYAYVIDGAATPTTFPEGSSFTLNPAINFNWDIYAQDASGCIVGPTDLSITLDPTPSFSANFDQCNGKEGNFSVNLTLDNLGVGPYYLIVDTNAPQLLTNWSVVGDIHTINGLNSGNHTFQIFDANGCGETNPLTIHPELQVSALVITQPTCDTNDGVIEFTVIGGDGSNEVTLLNAGTLTDTGLSPTGNQFVGVGFGDYIVRVTDTPITLSSCTVDASVTLEEPTIVTLLDTDWTNISCSGASDGTITINLAPQSVGVNDNPIYTYTIENTTTSTAPINQDSPLFTNLTSGIYNITVTSGRGCLATDQIELLDLSPLVADNPVVNPFTCDANNTINIATIDVTNISGGIPDYFYTIDGTNYLPISGNSFSHLVTVAGDYTIIIRDSNGCELPLTTVTVNPLPVITLAITEGLADCPNGQEINVTATGHSVPTDLSFELLETSEIQANLTTNTATFNLVTSGTYTIKVTDNVTGCYEFINHTINPKPQWNVAITAFTPVTCFGNADGTLEVSFTGYNGVYDYEVFNEDGTTTGVNNTNQMVQPLLISNMPAGNYYVSVTPIDYPYCEVENTLVTIIQSPIEELTAVAEDLLASGCSNDMGEISVIPNGGNAPYDITLTPSSGTPISVTGVFAHVFTQLSADAYTIQVTDSQGCLWNGSSSVNPTPNIVASAIGMPSVCYGDPNGSIVANASGGTGNFNYFLNYYDETGTNIEFTPSVPQQSNEFNFLSGGYYSVTITDDMGCSDTTAIIFLDSPNQLLAEVSLTTAMTCESPAVVTATAIGGTAPYLYQLEDDSGNSITSFQLNNVFSVSLAGTYRVRVIDANNCETLSQLPVIVPEIPLVQLTIDFASTAVSCADDMTAVIYASAIGGIGEYTFDLILGGSIVQSQIDSRKTVFEDLAPGDYTVRVTSEGGCNPDEESVSIENPDPLVFNSEITPETCVGELDGSITLMLSGGGGGYQFAISPDLDQFFDEDPEQGLPLGYYRFEDLLPGSYTVIAQDINGCFFVEEYTIALATEMMINYETTPENCEGYTDGSITLDISGGTAPYSTRLSTESSFVQDRLFFTDMAAGDYIIFVEDANGCTSNLAITINPGVNLNAVIEPIYECTGNIPENYINITFDDPSIVGDILYVLDSRNPDDLQLSLDLNDMKSSPEFRNISPGSHYLTIQHSGGCTFEIEFEIESFEPLTLLLEQNNINEITAIAEGGVPNYTFYFNDINNGTNNTYQINTSGTYVVRVVDQNGCEAIGSIEMEFVDIEIPGFFTPDGDGFNDFWLPNNTEGWPEIVIKIYDRYGRIIADDVVNRKGWDGLYKKNELPTGDYWYVIKLHGENDDRELVGHFTLYR